MQFPYGISDFKSIITEGYFYCDRTDRIPLIERSKSQLFIRPRRFGKSLLLSMLANYYDVAKKDIFETLFGHLKIGRNPTPKHNSYYILKFDFSCVDPGGSAEEVKQSLYDHINDSIKQFILYYRNFDLPKIEIHPENALSSLQSLVNSVCITPFSVYLFIDEYDNFANTVMMRAKSSEQRYQALVHDEGPLRTLFKAVKASTSGSMFERVFITGVSPVVMSDITSGYNIAENIYFEPEFNDLCGFTGFELENIIKKIAQDCDLDKSKEKQALDLMTIYYNGYVFSHQSAQPVFNPTLALYFLKQFEKNCDFPREMLDDNLAVDDEKLEYIAEFSSGRDLLLALMEKDHTVVTTRISKRFGIRDLLNDKSHDSRFLISFLYYFGVLTLAGETDDLETILKVPNLVIKSLYVERMERMFLPEPRDRDEGRAAARLVYTKGDIATLCRFVEKKFFRVFHNRDYRWANELTVKTAFLTLLYNDLVFIMDSEPELDRRYADLVMIIRPDKRHAKVFDILIEFKFVSLKDAGISTKDAESLSDKDLAKLPKIKESMEHGEKQVREYGTILENRHKNLRLKKFVVASLGFDRICCRQLLS